jgi:hypothetical protein
LTNYYYISWDYYLPLTVYIVNSSFHKSRSVNVAPCYLRRDLCHFVLANSGPLSLEKLMLCKSTDKMHSFNRRLSTQVCSCKEIKTLLSLEMWVHDKPQWQHCWGNFTCKITQYICIHIYLNIYIYISYLDCYYLLRTIHLAYLFFYSSMMECECHSMLSKRELLSLCISQQWTPVIPYSTSVDHFLWCKSTIEMHFFKNRLGTEVHCKMVN